MKTLHLLRHAKSSWDDPGLGDRERPLNRRGRRDAPRMGRALAQRLDPMVVYASPALRAQLTLGGVCDGWPELNALSHQSVEALYTFSSDDLAHWIAAFPGDDPALFLVSHNPALTDLVNELCAGYVLDNLPTAGYAQLTLRIDHWHELVQGCAILECTLFPKQLGDS